jgi:homoserine dehydrogenase
MRHIHIGLIGFGTVGSGVVRILTEQKDLIFRRLGAELTIAQIADLDIKRHRGVSVSKKILTTDARALIQNPKIDIVLELMGGIDPARTFILEAIRRGKHVVTANKALLASHGEAIFRAADHHKVEIGFEASVGGGIPIIRSIKEGLSGEKIQAIFGIVNGTSNYILTQMSEKGRSFRDVLKEAQQLGYAEADPTLDVQGGDSAHKLAILASLAYGTPVPMEGVYTEGIDKITPVDIAFSETFGYKIKLLAIAKLSNGRVEVRVHPTMIPKDDILAKVNGVFNAIGVIGESVGETLFYGRGAGSMPTGSAVVSDLVDIARNIICSADGTKKGARVPPLAYLPAGRVCLPIKQMAEIESRYYLRFMVEDRPGVLSKISGVLGKNRISIASVIQEGRGNEKGGVSLVMMTHQALERDIQAALLKIDQNGFITEPTILIRVEGRPATAGSE